MSLKHKESDPFIVKLMLPPVKAVVFLLEAVHGAACFAAKRYPVALGRPLLWLYLRVTAGFREKPAERPKPIITKGTEDHPPSFIEFERRTGLPPSLIRETLNLDREAKLEIVRAGLEDSYGASTQAAERVRCLAAFEPVLFLETLHSAVRGGPPSPDRSAAEKRAYHALYYLQEGVHAELFETIVELFSCPADSVRTQAAAHLIAFASDAVIPFLHRFSDIPDSFSWVRAAEAAQESGRATPAFRQALWEYLVERLESRAMKSWEIRLMFMVSPAESFDLLTREAYLDSSELGPAIIRETVNRRLALSHDTLAALMARPVEWRVQSPRALLSACVLAHYPGTEERIRALLTEPVVNNEDRTRVEAAYGLLLKWHRAPDLRKLAIEWENRKGEGIESMPEVLADASLLMGYGYFKDRMLSGSFQDLALDAPDRMRAALRRCGLAVEEAAFGTAMRALRGVLPVWKANGFLPEPECVYDIVASMLHDWRSTPLIYDEVARFAWEHREDAKLIAAGAIAGPHGFGQ